MASEQFSLCWDNFHKNMSSGLNALLENEDLVDVTLAVDGKFFKAHQMVLSVCSPYFKELFKANPCQHPIVFLKDVSYVAISDLLQFMYQGEVQVSQDNLTTFIKTAEALQIKGLTGDGNGTEADSEPPQDKPAERHVEETYKPMPRPKKVHPAPIVTTTPAIKKPRLSLSSNDQSSSAPITKAEPAIESSQFKVEPFDPSQSVTIPDDGDETFGDETLDDTTVDDNEDYSMMEGEEPQAGTSTDGAGEGQDLSKTLLKEMRKMNVKLSYMQEEISRLTYMVTNINRTVKKETVDEMHDFGVIFPMMSTEQLEVLEQSLDDPEKYNNLVEYIKQIGGGHVQDITHRAMQRIMGNHLGCMFSWLGKKGKMALRPYKIAAVFREAILLSSRKIERNTTERDVEKAIMQWLRQAPQRYKRVALQF